MRFRPRLTAVAAVASLALVAVAGQPAAAVAKSKVKTPESGEYHGKRDLILLVSGKTIDLAAFNFPCGAAKGRTSLNDIPLKKTKKGYKFSTQAHGLVTYNDDHPDENAAVGMSGRFTRSGKKPSGRLQVISPRCGDTGKLDWSAKLAR